MSFGYDAKAVAKIMGLTGAEPSGRRRTARSAPSTAGSPSVITIEKAVGEGLPRTVLRRVAQALVGGDATKVPALERSIVPQATLERRTGKLSLHESEQTERLARMFVHARRALGTDDEARAFMTTPHPELEGRPPLAAAATDLGTQRVETILNALEYGLAL